MPTPEEELIAREIGKLGALGSKLAGDSGNIAAAFSAKLAARLLPTEQYQIETIVADGVVSVLTKIVHFFGANGRVAAELEVAPSPLPRITGIVGSGFLNLNPTIVHAEVIVGDAKSTTLRITSLAKEGLIKQRSAEKAVRRLCDWLNRAGD